MGGNAGRVRGIFIAGKGYWLAEDWSLVRWPQDTHMLRKGVYRSTAEPWPRSCSLGHVIDIYRVRAPDLTLQYAMTEDTYAGRVCDFPGQALLLRYEYIGWHFSGSEVRILLAGHPASAE